MVSSTNKTDRHDITEILSVVKHHNKKPSPHKIIDTILKVVNTFNKSYLPLHIFLIHVLSTGSNRNI